MRNFGDIEMYVENIVSNRLSMASEYAEDVMTEREDVNVLLICTSHGVRIDAQHNEKLITAERDVSWEDIEQEDSNPLPRAIDELVTTLNNWRAS
jgi:hypothetical protein